MARASAHTANFSFATVQLEDELRSMEMNVDNNLPVVTSFTDTGEVNVEGLSASVFNISGPVDMAAAQGDATIFGQIGSGAAAVIFDPTGSGPGASNPTYNITAMVKSYSLKADVGGALEQSTSLAAQGIPVRTVA